ncbi:MAG: aminotransferase class I/II-fold pyridoxal phosphate-dependent enzyme, partial [Bacteroidia bacterium]
QLWTIANTLQSGLKERGFNLGTTSTMVTPIFLQGSEAEAGNLIIDLRENYDIFCSIVIYPVVPKGVMMLRLIPTASHSLADVQQTLDAFSDVAIKLKENRYATASAISA